MNKFVLAILASSSLTLIGTAAIAMDHHMAGEAAAPTHEDCAALHQQLMAEAGDDASVTQESVMAGLDAETRARAEACHAMMGAAHHEGGEDHGDHHDMPAAEEAGHGEHESHDADHPH